MTNYNGLLCLAGMECPVLLGRGFLFFCFGKGGGVEGGIPPLHSFSLLGEML